MNHRLLRFFQGLFLYIVTGILCASAIHAVGLGRIKVYSYLNEPLDAEIELLAASDVVDSLLVSVASADEFERANVPRIPLLDKLTFQIIRDDDEIFIHATSKTWVTEPYLDFLLNLSWGTGVTPGRLIRRYTILLDPIPPEGKPVYAKRRLIPNSIELPAGTAKVRYNKAASVTELTTASALLEAATEKGVPLLESDIPASIAAQTPQEKLAKISKQKAVTTPSVATVGAVAAVSTERNNMHALFEHHDKAVDLKTVIEDVERVIVSNHSPQTEIWFNENAAEPAPNEDKSSAPIEGSPKTTDKPLETVKPPVPVTEPAHAVPAAKSPAVTPPVPEVIPVPEKNAYWKPSLGLISTLGITLLAVGLLLWRWWQRHRQFSATRERLAQLSREAIEEERAAAGNEALAEQEAPLQPTVEAVQAATPTSAPAEEPFNMADLDLVLGADEITAPPSSPPPLAMPVETEVEAAHNPVVDTIATDSLVLPNAVPLPAVEEIQIDLDTVGSVVPASPAVDPEEINLKLQLARQYVELGDFTGAKELLMVVNTQGNAEQRTEAQELLEKII